MAICRLSTSARNAATGAISALVDLGSGPGTIKIYTGAPPATPNTAPSGVLLATIPVGDPAFAAPVNGAATGTDPASVNADSSGNAGWFRLADSDGNAVMDGDVTDSAGTGTLKLDSTTLTAGLPVDISSLSHATPVG